MTGTGPVVFYLGIVTNMDGCVFCCDPSCAAIPTPTPEIEFGRQVFEAKNGQFIIVIEGGPGTSKQAVGIQLGPVFPSNRPDLQIENTRGMGANPSTAVCDLGPASAGGGGIPGINPPDFTPDPNPTPGFVTNALNDFACRFQSFSQSFPCTYVDSSGSGRFVNTNATTQFCDAVTGTAAFPPGDSLLTVQLRDTVGNIGPTAQIVVRVATPTPTRTATPRG
jgi:hypothetical protein